MMITISKENYLKAIAEAEAEGKTVISALLAHWLSVTPPAVTAALKRLRRDGLVTIDSGRIQLTSEGRKVAERTILRHHLIERMNPEQRRKKGQRLLSEAEAGSRYQVCSVYERDRKLLEFLQARGIRPGTRLKVESQNYDGTAILKVERKRIALGSPVAERIWVAREHERKLR